MRVLLLNPKRLAGISYTVIPNIGLGHIANSLREAGHEPMVVDANRDNLSPEAFAELVGRTYPEMVGITTFSSFLNEASAYGKAARVARPDVTIVLGGPHPTFLPEHSFTAVPEADYMVCGEGENALPALCDHLEKGAPPIAEIPNLAYRDEDRIIENPRCWIEDIDALGPPAWDLLEPDHYPLAPNGIFSRAKKIAPIIATRGCPFNCSFCGAQKAMGKTLRKRSAVSIRDEMELLHTRYGIGEIHFMDDNFTHDPALVHELCSLIELKGPALHWACPNGVRLDKIDPQLVRHMERAGCYSLALGIEFGTDRLLRATNKGLTVERIEKQVRMLVRETAMRLTGFFIIGHPDETEKEIRKTIAFSLRLPLHKANFFNFTPFPGSPLYDHLKAAGKLEDVNLSDLYIHTIAYHPKAVSAKKMAALQRKAHLRFYLRPKIFFGILGEIHRWAQLKVLFARAWRLIFGK